MAAFTDRQGNSWEVSITIGTIGRLKRVGVNLLSADWVADIELVGRALWVLCESQATARGITEEQFVEGFDGPTLARAMDAIDEEYTVFSLRRPAMAEAARKRLPQIRSQQEQRAIQAIERLTWNDIAGNSQASAE